MLDFLLIYTISVTLNVEKLLIIRLFSLISYFICKNLRREVWTVKVTKNLSYTLQHHINFILRIYMEASVRRF